VPAHAAGFPRGSRCVGKQKILRGSLRADVSRLVRLLLAARGARRERRGAPPPRRAALARALQDLIGHLPVYRTYVDARGGPVHPDDVRVVDAAAARAAARDAEAAAAVAPLRACMLREGWDAHRRGTSARGGWSSCCGSSRRAPATAKGRGGHGAVSVRAAPLAERVGGEPAAALHDAVGTLHRANAERAARWPRALVCTNTHDTSVAPDVRARLDGLSEIPTSGSPRRRRGGARTRRSAAGRGAARGAGREHEYLLYQTLVGVWPAGPDAGAPDAGAPDAGAAGCGRAGMRARSTRCARAWRSTSQGGARGEKQRSTWTESDERYEEGCARSSPRSSTPARSAAWAAGARGLVERVARPGCGTRSRASRCTSSHPARPTCTRVTSCGRSRSSTRTTAARSTTPSARGCSARSTRDAGPNGTLPPDRLAALLASPEDGRVKLVPHVAAAARAPAPARRCSARAANAPLARARGRAAHLVAFARLGDGGPAVTLAPRLPLTLAGGGAAGRRGGVGRHRGPAPRRRAGAVALRARRARRHGARRRAEPRRRRSRTSPPPCCSPN
jgi:(1->4)-alpha-D-glucan 1-alpha-D-glucosylmutase